MQRWFFANEAETCHVMPDAGPTSSTTSTSTSSSAIPERPWTFRVLMNLELELYPNERVAVVGNCHALGYWQSCSCVVMTREEGRNIWSTSLNIPSDRPTDYRYLICAIDPATEQLIVRRWETHLKPRSIAEAAQEPTLDMFGVVDQVEKIDRGWLTSETIVQLKFIGAPFTWQEKSMRERMILVKVTPMNLRIPEACDNRKHRPQTPSSSEDQRENEDPRLNENENPRLNEDEDPRLNEDFIDSSTAFAFNEVAALNSEEDDCVIKPQPEFGTRCTMQGEKHDNDIVIFHLTIGDVESTAYQIDLFTYSSKALPDDEPPYHLGYQTLMPNLFKRSEGTLKVPIACATTHRPLGMMQLRYLIVRPLSTSLQQDMKISYTRHWNPKWSGLDCGHRGCGKNSAGIRENSVASVKNAADHGADMVEFDVQLSRDLVPIVYHDFRIHAGPLKSRPVGEFTFDQLRQLHFESDLDDQPENAAFPQLAEVLDAIDPDLAFNIEVKWSQRRQDGTMEENFDPPIDRNSYVDCILDVVLRLGGKRRILLSCFDADICTMLRFKQNRYPTMFVIQSASPGAKAKRYMDPRGWSLDTAMFNSLAMELLGVVANADDLLRDPFQINMVKNRDLILFCWAGEHNSMPTIKVLKELGLHGIIYDLMDI